MTRFFCDTPVTNSQRMREHPAVWYRTGGVAGRDELDANAGRDQAPGEDVDDVLGATVGEGWDGQPWWCDDADP